MGLAQTDIYIVIGFVLALLSIPAFFSALVDKRLPLVSVIVLGMAGLLLYWAHIELPQGLTLTSVPDAVINVIAWVLRR